MHTLSVTYKAPPGDSKVTEVFGHTFFDGKPETITVDDRVLGKLKNHPLFDCGPSSAAEPHKGENPPPKRFQKGEKDDD